MFETGLSKGKSIIITGGGTGLGKSMATRFAELGADLVITSRRQNVIDETAEAQLVATLPVATNLPWVVALLGGVPAAAGVYITSKIVQKQVDRLSSISYELTGPWDDINITVDKIFASELERQPLPDALANDQ